MMKQKDKYVHQLHPSNLHIKISMEQDLKRRFHMVWLLFLNQTMFLQDLVYVFFVYQYQNKMVKNKTNNIVKEEKEGRKQTYEYREMRQINKI